jgi:2-phospho-L-lactate guanylyltransferase
VLVPAKSFARAKSRLSPVLDACARKSLARSMLEHVLGVLASCPEIAGVMVATDGDDVAALAGGRGAVTARDRGSAPLGAIVDQALAELSARSARSALVIMSDLPLLTGADVRRLVDRMAGADMVAAPDWRGEGTNALGLTPPLLLSSTSFGTRDSFARHLRSAAERGLHVDVDRSFGLGFDVDEPADLEKLRAS